MGYLSQDPPSWPDPKQRVIDVVADAWLRCAELENHDACVLGLLRGEAMLPETLAH